jgi:YD repeat-containing protein
VSFIQYDLRRSTAVLSNHHDGGAQREKTQDYHGKGRLTEKNDAALPRIAASAIQAGTPSDIFNWQGRPNL